MFYYISRDRRFVLLCIPPFAMAYAIPADDPLHDNHDLPAIPDTVEELLRHDGLFRQ